MPPEGIQWHKKSLTDQGDIDVCENRGVSARPVTAASVGVTFTLQGQLDSARQWADLARQAEAGGFDTIGVADHPGLTCSPFVALAAAAGATSTIALATLVLNGGVRAPLDIASDVATLDLLAPGRVVLGIGAGHTPTEWTAAGKRYPTPRERVDRLAEHVATIPRLLTGGTVSHVGEQVQLVEARLATVPDRPVPLMIGGNGRRVMGLAAEHVDIVHVGGLGATLSDGHLHEIRWSTADVDSISDHVWRSAELAGRRPALEALAQLVTITDDPERVATRFLDSYVAMTSLPRASLPSIEELLATPFVLVGSLDEIVAKIADARDRWGFSRYTIRASALDAGVAIIEALRNNALPSKTRRRVGSRVPPRL